MNTEDMKLRDKQKLFTRLVADLIAGIYAMGYSCTLGDGYRDPKIHGKYGEKKSYAASKSLHKIRLAIDLNLFDLEGNYIKDGGHEAYARVGKFWKLRHELCEWGGDEGRHDANHFSLAHDGMW